MSFQWLIKNKHFQKGGNLKAQVTPLLIVVMVILLIAALTTINIGRIALDKTYSSNATDAGALAAASEYDAAFNELAREMELPTDDPDSPGGLNFRLYMNFVASHAAYNAVYEDANDNIWTAIALTLSALALFWAAWEALMKPPIFCSIYVNAIIATALALLSAVAIWEATRQAEEFYIRAQYMLSITESFHENQWDFYESIREFMDDSRDISIDLGYSYAFSNSGITEKLSVAQSNEYSAWIGDSEGKPYLSGVYEWNDKLDQSHRVEVEVDVPWITAYDLQHTRDSFSDIKDHLDTIIDRCPLIITALNATYGSISTYGALCLIEFILSIVMVALCSSGYTIAAAKALYWSGMIPLWNKLFAGWGPLILAYLAGLVAVAGAVSLYLLQAENDAAHDGWETDEPNIHVTRNPRAAPYANYVFDDTLASDLMIVSIYDTIMESWNITVNSRQTHPGTQQGIIQTTYPVVAASTVVDFYGEPYMGGNHDSMLKIWNFENYQFDSKITNTT